MEMWATHLIDLLRHPNSHAGGRHEDPEGDYLYCSVYQDDVTALLCLYHKGTDGEEDDEDDRHEDSMCNANGAVVGRNIIMRVCLICRGLPGCILSWRYAIVVRCCHEHDWDVVSGADVVD